VLAQRQPDYRHARGKGDLSEYEGRRQGQIAFRLAKWPAIDHATLKPTPLILEARPDSRSTMFLSEQALGGKPGILPSAKIGEFFTSSQSADMDEEVPAGTPDLED